MNPLGSLGPDGFPAQFYQNQWEVVEKDICNFTLHILNQGGLLNGINDTFITLISKIKEQKKLVDFMPISLYNMIYKIISKTLANRLNSVLHEIISFNQSAYVPGKFITGNILVAYETLHSMNSQMKRKTGFMAFKLNMSKVYDKVE